MDILNKLREELQVERWQVEAAVKLIDEGNTIPFISRYRKEATGSLNDEVLHYGVEKFVKECNACGVDGLIIPDLPLEEQEELQTQLQKEDGTILIQLVSPVSKDRVPKILKNARGFVYCVSSMGVTGQEATFHRQILEYLTAVKKEAKIPVMMGFGIRTAEDVRPMKEIIDGAIVGSHFITLMREHGFDPQAAADYCSTFKKELNEM